MSAQDIENPFHGTAVSIGGKGVLIAGASGSGKSALALTLIRRAHQGGIKAGLVADDWTVLDQDRGRLIASCPPQLTGKIEVRGYGIGDVSAIIAEPTSIELLVRLVPEAEALRYAEDHAERLGEVELQCLRLPAGPLATAPTAIFAALGLPVWT